MELLLKDLYNQQQSKVCWISTEEAIQNSFSTTCMEDVCTLGLDENFGLYNIALGLYMLGWCTEIKFTNTAQYKAVYNADTDRLVVDSAVEESVKEQIMSEIYNITIFSYEEEK